MKEVETGGSHPVSLHLEENGGVLVVDEQGMMYRFGSDGSYEGVEDKTSLSLLGNAYFSLSDAAFGARLGPQDRDAMVFAAPQVGGWSDSQVISYYWNDKGGFYKKWSAVGEDAQILTPVAVALDNAYRRVIVLEASGRLQIFSIVPTETEPHRYITKWGGYGEGDGQFISASAPSVDVEVDSKGRIYVLDMVGGEQRKRIRIQVFEP